MQWRILRAMTPAERRRLLLDQVRDAIEASGLTLYAISKRTGVDQSTLSRFMRSERGLSVDALERISELLNLHIVAKKGKK